MKKVAKFLGVLLLLGVAANAIKSINGSPISANAVSSDGQTTNVSARPMPKDEAAFVRAVQKAQADDKTAANDMQKGGVRASRENELCKMLGALNAANWVGDVYSISSNSDGKGVLAITVAPGVYIQTWNNAFSDIADSTLIEPNSPTFTKASQLKEGQQVKFSGTFFRDAEDTVGCLKEGSLTLDGKLSEPEFIFRFSDVAAI